MSSRHRRSTRKLRVMYTFSRLDESSSPYARLLVQSLGDGLELGLFSWRRLLLGWPDVLHVHWPEDPASSPNRKKAVVKQLLILIFVRIRKCLGVGIVRTLHNASPHEEQGWLARRALHALDRATDHTIHLNRYSHANADGNSTLILHGDLLAAAKGADPSSTFSDDFILTFGQLRPYKGIEELLQAYGAVHNPDLRLRVVGRPVDHVYADHLANLAGSSPTIELIFSHLSDAELVAAIRRSRLVVLPHRDMFNSGALILSLATGTRTCVPDTPVNRSLALEFGDDLLRLYTPPLTPEYLRAEMARSLCRIAKNPPAMDGRQWDRAAAKHLEVYAHVSSHRTRKGLCRVVRR